MTVSTLRPSSTSANTGTLVGGATAHAVLSDDSDSSYIQQDSGETATVGLTDLTLPAGSVIKSVAIRTRVAKTNVTAGQVVANSTITGGISSPAFTASVTSFVPATFTLVTQSRTGITDSDADAATLRVHAGTGGPIRVYEAYLDVAYVNQATVTVDAPTGTVSDTNQPTVSWTPTLDSDGGAQTGYIAKIFTSAQYGAGGFDPAVSTPLYTSGIVASAATSHQIDTTLADATNLRAYVRVRQTVNATDFWGVYSYSTFTQSVSLPAAPTFTATADNANARIQLDFDDNSGAATTDYFEVQRSLDSGTTWTTVRQLVDGVLTPTAGVYQLFDYEAPNGFPVVYRGRALHDYSGVYAASAWVEDTESWSSGSWWLKHPTSPALNMTVRIRSFQMIARAGRQGVFQSLGATVPVVVSDTRESGRGTVVLRLDSLDEQDALDALLDTTGTLLLQSPPGGGGPDYIRVVDHQRARAVDWQTSVPSFDSLDFVVVGSAAGTVALFPSDSLFPG